MTIRDLAASSDAEIDQLVAVVADIWRQHPEIMPKAYRTVHTAKVVGNFQPIRDASEEVLLLLATLSLIGMNRVCQSVLLETEEEPPRA